MKKSFILLFLSLSLINWNCKKVLCELLELCDLASNIVLPATGITLGTDLGVVNEVLNYVAESVDCTEDAPTSMSDFDLYYRANPDSDWAVVPDGSDQRIQIGTIKPSQSTQHTLTYIFNQPGQYQFKTAADYDLKVAERDDNNNDATAGGKLAVGGNNVFVSEILTVYPDPNKAIDPSLPPATLKSIVRTK